MEEAQVLGERTAHAHVAARMVAAAGLQDRIESERPEAVKDFVQDPPIRVRDAEDAAAVATPRIEDSGEKPKVTRNACFSVCQCASTGVRAYRLYMPRRTVP